MNCFFFAPEIYFLSSTWPDNHLATPQLYLATPCGSPEPQVGNRCSMVSSEVCSEHDVTQKTTVQVSQGSLKTYISASQLFDINYSLSVNGVINGLNW